MAVVHGRRAAAAADDRARGRPASGCPVTVVAVVARAGAHRLGQRPVRLRPREEGGAPQHRRAACSRWWSPTRSARCSAPRSADRRRPTVPCACSWPSCRPRRRSRTSTRSSSRGVPPATFRWADAGAVPRDAGVPGRRSRTGTSTSWSSGSGRAAARRTPFRTAGRRRRRLPERRPGPGALGRAGPRRARRAPSSTGSPPGPGPRRPAPGSRWTASGSARTSPWPGSAAPPRSPSWVRPARRLRRPRLDRRPDRPRRVPPRRGPPRPAPLRGGGGVHAAGSPSRNGCGNAVVHSHRDGLPRRTHLRGISHHAENVRCLFAMAGSALGCDG